MEIISKIESIDDVVGYTVESVRWTSQFLCLTFTTGESAMFEAVGDCCSRSWFEHVEVESFNGEIMNVDNNNGSDDHSDWDETKSELTRVYFMTVSTDHGRLHVEMRNQSNGYYGGYIEPVTERRYSNIADRIMWKDAE